MQRRKIMKKFITLILVFVLVFSMSGCELFSTHEHEFVLDKNASTVTCTKDGNEVYVCSCGEKDERPTVAYGHDFQVLRHTDPTCTSAGTTDYRCTKCGRNSYENLVPTGHNYEESPSEPSRVIQCLNDGCVSAQWATVSNGKHDEALTFSFTKEDEAELDAKYDEVLAMVKEGGTYDAALHTYAEEGALADAYAVVDEAHTEYYELVMNAIAQRQLAEVAYYCDMNNTEKEETYSYMLDYYTALIAKFYTLSRPFYDSCYREFYYYGMTEEEINSYLFDSDALSNPEYTALKERNNAIEVEFLAITTPQVDSSVPALYAEYVQNNNAMARLMGYDNYLEYAYENVYGREYSYQYVSEDLVDYVKNHISPVYNKVYGRWNSISGNTEGKEEYNNHCSSPFFVNLQGNTTVNDYIDIMAFTTNPDKQVSFSDEFNKLMGDGNMFRGDYQGAFVTTISSANLPIAYFGRGYNNSFTVVHEFGHYMNEIYNGEHEDISQSYDLLEMHSQGNELLYLYFLESHDDLSDAGFNFIETYQLVNMLYAVMSGMTIDTFEQAIYLDHYEGTGADVIMADGTITSDEYDALYSYICEDFGASNTHEGYWRYGMTITSACYYVSYSVSALAVLQLYEMAHTESFDAAKDAYLKLFTYTDESTEMNMEDVLEYAGMLSYMDEELYIRINEFLMNK